MRRLHCVIHNRCGNAYLFVVVAVLMVTMLAGAALAVTVAGRRVSARYIYFAGPYDLAVAGNEQALFYLREALQAVLQGAQDDAHNDGELSPSDIVYALLPAAADASQPWEVVFFGEVFRAATAVSLLPPGPDNPSDAVFRVQTSVSSPVVVGAPGGAFPAAVHTTVVRADIVLDAASLTMVHSRRITN